MNRTQQLCAIVMPAYNEAGCIRGVCEEWIGVLAQLGDGRLIVVNDGSTDETGFILDRLAEQFSQICVVHQENVGHGAAIRRGYATALELGCGWVFQVDSDRQFEAGEMLKLWALRDSFEFLLGVRSERKDPLLRRLLSKGHRLLVTLFFGVRVRDPNTPFRLMQSDLLEILLELIPEEAFAPNVFLSILAAGCGCRFKEVPVRHLPRVSGCGSIGIRRLPSLVLRCAAELIRFRTKFRAADRRLREELKTCGEFRQR